MSRSRHLISFATASLQIVMMLKAEEAREGKWQTSEDQGSTQAELSAGRTLQAVLQNALQRY